MLKRATLTIKLKLFIVLNVFSVWVLLSESESMVLQILNIFQQVLLTNSEVLFIAQIPYQLYVEVVFRAVSLSIKLLEFDVGKVRFQHVKCQQLKGAIISSSSS